MLITRHDLGTRRGRFRWWFERKQIWFMMRFPKIYMFLKYDLRKARYQWVCDKKTYKVYEKDRLLFWRKPRDTGALFV